MFPSWALETRGPVDFNVNLDIRAMREHFGRNTETAMLTSHCWLAVLTDSPLQTTYGQKPLKVFRQFQHELKTSMFETIRKYSSLGDQLAASVYRCNEEGAETLTCTFIDGFKKTPVFKEFHQFYMNGDSSLFRYLLTFCYFAKKAEFVDSNLNKVAFRNWLDVENGLGSLTFADDLTSALKKIIECILGEPSPTVRTFMGKNGSGAVAEGVHGTIEKLSTLKIDAKLRRYLSIASPLAMGRNWNPFSDSNPLIKWILSDVPNQSYEAVMSELLFVPKNYKTTRSICKEPILYMILQQHLRWELEEAISRGLIGRFVKIDQQERNQIGCMYGAKTGAVDTIDLSAASDSVALNLVKKIFPRKWLHPMLSCRTTNVKLPDGNIKKLNKFAPMGSAVCFPTQSIVYTAVVVLAYMYHADKDLRILDSTSNAIKRWITHNISCNFATDSSYETICVYGDDIICDSRTSHIVISILDELGFTVNAQKSYFAESAFRESCGVYSLMGYDVTPFQFKVKHLGKSFDTRSLSSVLDLCNRAGDYGYKNLHKFLIQVLLNYSPPPGCVKNPIRFTNDRNEFGIYTKKPMLFRAKVGWIKTTNNTHMQDRHNGELQRDEVRGWQISSARIVTEEVHDGLFHGYFSVPKDRIHLYTTESNRVFHMYNYSMKNRSNAKRSETTDSLIGASLSVPLGTKLVWRWMPDR